MNKKILLITILLTITTTGCTLSNAKAGIIVKSQPSGKVYINDKEVGRTPYENKELQPGYYVVKIKSEQGEWTSDKIRILENTIYSINQELAPNSTEQAGEKISIEKGKGITIVTMPSQVTVSLNGVKQGNSPYLIPTVPEGEHEITLEKEGYITRKIKIRTKKDYKVVIEAQLKKEKLANTTVPSPIPEDTAVPSPTKQSTLQTTTTTSTSPTATAAGTLKTSPLPTPAKNSPTPAPDTAQGTKTITVLTTPTGWLRVRDKASIDGKEIAKINQGETYEYIQQLETGWTQIVLEDGTQGYVASRYVKVNK